MSMAGNITPTAARAACDQACEEHDVGIRDLMSPRRTPRLARARWRAMQIMRDRGASLPAIGRHLQLHHTTVLHGLRRIQEAY